MAFTTIGAIAINSIHQARVQFGEIVAVIGLGLIGMIALKILIATAHNVIRIDIGRFKVEFTRKCGVKNVTSVMERYLDLEI